VNFLLIFLVAARLKKVSREKEKWQSLKKKERREEEDSCVSKQLCCFLYLQYYFQINHFNSSTHCTFFVHC
jgi:hypothetical protein